MVRYQLNSAQQWLDSQGVALVRRPNYGFEIKAPPQGKAALLRKLDSDTERVLQCPSERVYQLLLLIFTHDEPLLAKQLWNQFRVSRSTILSDLTKARMWLECRGLFLLRRASFGLQLRGEEARIREAFVALLLEIFDRSELLTLCSSSRPGLALRQVSTSADLYLDYVQPLTARLSFARALVHSWQNHIGAELSDDSYVTLMLYLAVVMERLSKDHSAPDEPGQLQIWHRRFGTPSAQPIVQRMERYLGRKLTQGDVTGLEAQLSTVRVQRALGTGDAEPREPQLKVIVDALLDEAAAYLHPWLKVDRELRNSLTHHLQPTLHRLEAGLPIDNPLLKDIQEFDGYVYQVAKRCADILGASVSKPVPPAEIGYLAMHLAAAMERVRPQIPLKRRVLVVCGEGSASAWMLVSRLRTEFPDVEISAVKSSRQVCQADLYEVDAVVSIYPFQAGSVPSRTVSPLLLPEDLAALRDILAAARPVPMPTTAQGEEWSGPPLCDLITQASIALRVHAVDWLDVVNKATCLLQRMKAVDARYGQAVKEVIIAHGPYMVTVPGVALLHAKPGMGVNRLAMALMTLDTPVEFGNPENDPVDLVFALAAIDHRQHRRALLDLVRVIREPSVLNALRKATSANEISQILTEVSRTTNLAEFMPAS
jgi:transcriptional antiterminator/mannitol/fructose-specific phosphotransferase system IIA component (Ntr-type)